MEEQFYFSDDGRTLVSKEVFDSPDAASQAAVQLLNHYPEFTKIVILSAASPNPRMLKFSLRLQKE